MGRAQLPRLARFRSTTDCSGGAASGLPLSRSVSRRVLIRFLAIGPIRRGLVLVVLTEQNEETIRIISARWATTTERDLYRAHLRGSRDGHS